MTVWLILSYGVVSVKRLIINNNVQKLKLNYISN